MGRKEFNARLKALENIQQPHLGPWKDMRDYEARIVAILSGMQARKGKEWI